MNWNIVEVCHQSLALFNLIVLFSPRKVNILTLIRLLVWQGWPLVAHVEVILVKVGVERLPVVLVELL